MGEATLSAAGPCLGAQEAPELGTNTKAAEDLGTGGGGGSGEASYGPPHYPPPILPPE